MTIELDKKVDIELDDEYKITTDNQQYRLVDTTAKSDRTVAYCSTIEYALEVYVRRKGRLSGSRSFDELQSVIREAKDVVQDVKDQLEVDLDE